MERGQQFGHSPAEGPTADTPTGRFREAPPAGDAPADELPAIGGIADSVRAILGSAEDAAAAIRADAEGEARRIVEETEKRLTELWRERSSAIHRLTDSVVTQGKALESQIEELRMQATALSSTMRDAIQSLRAEAGQPESPQGGGYAADDPAGSEAGPDAPLGQAGDTSPPAVASLRKWFKGESSAR